MSSARMISRGKADARKLATRGSCSRPTRRGGGDEAIATSGGSVRTSRGGQRFVEEGLEAALLPTADQADLPRKLDGEQEAKLIALACSTAARGQGRWTLRLLAERMVELEHVDTLSHETVRQTLKKTSSSRT